MVYNDTTNKSGLLQDFEFLIGAADGQISGDTTKKAQVTSLFNKNLHKAVTIVLDSLDGWDYDDQNHTDYPVKTANLVGGQQDYPFGIAEKVLKIKRVEVSYDGANWYKAEPFDINQRGSDTNNLGDLNKNTPLYDMQYGAIFLYPIPDANVTGGLKVWVTREPDEFTTSDTTQEPGLDEPFHRYISLGAAVDWALARRLDNYSTLKAELLELEQRMKSFYSSKIDENDTRLSAAYVNYE
jgi:hypothetical protein